MPKFWLALDGGTGGAKAVLMDSDGRTLRSAFYSYPTRSLGGGIAEQDVHDWWQAAADAIRELDAREAEAVAITGQMQDVVLINAAGQPARPVILYSDTRAHAESAEINEKFGADHLRQLTGNDQEAGSLLAKLLWLTSHEPQSLNQSRFLLMGAADYLAFRLTGQAVTDTTTASTTGLLDIHTRQALSSDILERIGLSHVCNLLPFVHAGGTQIGTVLPDIAAQLRLTAGIPVFHGPGDAGAATLGAGSGEIGQPYGYLGTSGWVAFSSAHQADPQKGVFTLAHPRADHFICVAPILTAGGNLEWLRGLFDQTDSGELIHAALSAPLSNLLYLPYLNGERSPFSDPFARGAFIGLQSHHTRHDLSRAMLEGVAFAYRHALDALITEPVTGLVLTGGGTRSPKWSQLIATITGVPITIAADASNVGARGALLAAQVTAGQRATYAQTIAAQESFQPDLTLRAHYDRQYELFRAAYPALKPIFAQMSAL